MKNVLNKTTKMDYADLLCWLLQNEDEELLLIEGEEYKKFQESNDEYIMDMEITDTETIYENGIAGADIYKNEKSFVSAKITENLNDIFLRLNVNGIAKDYVLLYA